MNPVGSGARALGMGGAFIAIADDATAASWNPGGLIQLEKPELSMVGAYFQRIEETQFGVSPEADGEQRVDGWNLNHLSGAYPLRALNRNMIVAINYQRLFDMSRQWTFPLSIDGDGFQVSQDVEIDQEGSLSALGFAYCVQLTPWVSFGVTVNIWSDDLTPNSWETKTRQTGRGNHAGNRFTFNSETREHYSFRGFNANLGFLWHVSSRFTLGAVLKTPFTADLTHEKDVSTGISYPEEPERDSITSSSAKTVEELDMPLSYGIGLAYRFSDALTAALDLFRTEWDDYILTDSKGNELSPITGGPAEEADIDPTHQVRAGVEYLYIGNAYVIPFRGGIFYDPAPAVGSPDDYYGFSLGAGLARGRLIFDIAYQYRFGNDVGKSILSGYDFSQDVKEHIVYTSIIYHL